MSQATPQTGETSITLEGGKYTVIHQNGTNFRALRNGEPWRDLTGDGMTLALVQRIQELEEREQHNAALFQVDELTIPPHAHWCDGCDWTGTAVDLKAIESCALTAGDPVPSGRCPACDALTYPKV